MFLRAIFFACSARKVGVAVLPGCEIRSRAVCTASIIFSARAMDFSIDALRDFDAFSSVNFSIRLGGPSFSSIDF